MNQGNISKSSSKLAAFLQVSRANLLLASIGHATIGLFLAASTLIELIQIKVIAYIILHYMIALLGCNINSYSDYDVDKLYKTYMSDGVDILGKKLLRHLIVVEAILALFLISYFFINGFIIVSLLAIIGFFSAILYSVEPVRIKKHGLISPLPVIILYSFPLLGGWFVFNSSINWIFVVFVMGYVLLNEGFTLVNTCEDFSEDKQKNILTWAHLFGLRTTLHIAFIFSLSGLLCIFSLIFFLVEKPMNSLVFYISFISIIFSAILIVKASLEVHEVVKGSDLEKRSKEYGIRLQRWFMMTRYPLMISSFLIILL